MLEIQMQASQALSVAATPSRRLPTRIRSITGALAIVGIAACVATGSSAHAANVANVDLHTAAAYSVLAGQTVTNTGPSVLAGSVGLFPLSAVDGFPPGLVLAPGVINAANPAAQVAQSDLTAAYLDAASRPITASTTADLSGLTLMPGVYAGPSKSELGLTGALVLDGAGDPSSVFVFQTDSTLITSSSSSVTLINGALECNVFWQVGSSATLGTGSTFAGNILALTSITVTNGVTVHGKALARNGAVTLENDTFTAPTCGVGPFDTTPPASTVVTATTVVGGGTGSSEVASTEVVPTTAGTALATTTPEMFQITLPSTGNRSLSTGLVPAFVAVGVGILAVSLARRRASSAN
jgi:Ice-binding-like